MRCRFGPRSGFTHPIINTSCYHRHVNTLSSTHTPSTHHDYHTDINTPSLSHTHINATSLPHSHRHTIINTQTSTRDRSHTNINTTSLSRNHVPHASTLSISTVFSLFRIVKPNMWGYHGLSWVIRSFFLSFSMAESEFQLHGHWVFHIFHMTTRHHTRPGAQSFAAVSLSSASLSCGSTLGRPPRAKDMVRARASVWNPV